MVEIVFNKGKYIPVVMTSAIFMSIIVPYIIAVTRNKVRAFLPYFNHAAAFPPQSAIHSIFMTTGALFGIFAFSLRFVAIEHRRQRLEAKKISVLNRTALAIGVVANISIVFASHFPVAFVTHNKYDWLNSVIVPHFLGMAVLVTSFTMYILIQSYLTYAQRKKSSTNVSGHAILAMCAVITNWTTCLPFYAAMREMLPRTIDKYSGQITLEAEEYSFYYIISSLSSWAFMLLILLFIVTFYRDIKRMHITLKLTPKLVKLDTVEPAMRECSLFDEMTKM